MQAGGAIVPTVSEDRIRLECQMMTVKLILQVCWWVNGRNDIMGATQVGRGSKTNTSSQYKPVMRLALEDYFALRMRIGRSWVIWYYMFFFRE